MKSILITGSKGFIGQNLLIALNREKKFNIYEFDIGCDIEQLVDAVKNSEAIFHLAAVNRPERIEDYQSGNVGFTRQLVSIIEKLGVKPNIIFSSSIQAILDNPYGRSKREAEEVLSEWAHKNQASVIIFRLPNVFGKWCRPNYNSAVATFCHNIARDIEINITDPERILELVYVDDVVRIFRDLLDKPPGPGVLYSDVSPVFRVKITKVVELLISFRESRNSLIVPDLADPFIKRLYATYLSYLPEDDFAYKPEIKSDNRGSLAELLKSLHGGQIFVSRTKPGIIRGNHYHDTKVEKFIVLDGEALIKLRHIKRNDIIEYRVSGDDLKIVDIPPGYTHSIENVGTRDLLVLFWASEMFDPQQPDTFPLEVKV